jgi:hypothetical protein
LENDSVLVRDRGCRQGYPPDILLKFATRAKSKIYHVPGGDHPSMIAHAEVTVAAIVDAANAVSRQRQNTKPQDDRPGPLAAGSSGSLHRQSGHVSRQAEV